MRVYRLVEMFCLGDRVVQISVLGRVTVGSTYSLLPTGLDCYAYVYEKMGNQEGMFLVSCARRCEGRKLAMPSTTQYSYMKGSRPLMLTM